MNNQRNSSVIFSIFCFSTSVVFFIIEKLSFLHPSLKKQFIKNRDLKTIRTRHYTNAKKTAIFYCSSAGEYLQIEPLIEKIAEEFEPHIFFFSVSGTKYAQAKSIPYQYSLCPRDSSKSWRLIFNLIKPAFSIINRYELWPNFIKEAKRSGPLYLVNFSQQPPLCLTKKILLSYFDKIFYCSKKTGQFLHKESPYIYCSDTKYDYVAKRASKTSLEPYRFLQNKDRSTVILGSIWKPDLDMFLKTVEKHPHLLQNTNFILCPHELGMVHTVKKALANLNIEYDLFSEAFKNKVIRHRILVVDTIGHLFELYGISDRAYVGGALHYKVHNVLEPVVFGLPTAFGPFFDNSMEACRLADEKIVTIINTRNLFHEWLLCSKKNTEQLINHIRLNSGGTLRIANHILQKTLKDHV